MEKITDAMSNIKIEGGDVTKQQQQKKKKNSNRNRIQVSNTKKPLFYYVNLAKKLMQKHNVVELSGLGMAISTVVSITEILKNNGFAVEKKITTSTVEIVTGDESRSRIISKAKIGIILGKTEKFDELMAAAAEERRAGGREE